MADESLAACLAEIKANPGRFYVYVLSRPCGTPFYVGCAAATEGRHQHRVLDHEQMARRGQKSRKSSVIRKLWKAGEALSYAIDSWHDTVEQVFAAEVALIAAIGRRDFGLGPLANGNDGGTGNLKMVTRRANRIIKGWTEEKRKLAAEKARAIQLAHPEHLENAKVAAKAAWADPVRREKMLADRAEASMRPERRARASASAKARMTPARREQIGELSKARWRAPESREVMLTAIRTVAATPDFRHRRAEIAKAQFDRPGRREQAAERLKTQWLDPEFRAAQLERMKGLDTDERRARQKAALEAYWTPERRAEKAAQVRGNTNRRRKT